VPLISERRAVSLISPFLGPEDDVTQGISGGNHRSWSPATRPTRQKTLVIVSAPDKIVDPSLLAQLWHCHCHWRRHVSPYSWKMLHRSLRSFCWTDSKPQLPGPLWFGRHCWPTSACQYIAISVNTNRSIFHRGYAVGGPTADCRILHRKVYTTESTPACVYVCALSTGYATRKCLLNGMNSDVFMIGGIQTEDVLKVHPCKFKTYAFSTLIVLTPTFLFQYIG